MPVQNYSARIAASDISIEYPVKITFYTDESGSRIAETWTVSQAFLFTKEQRRLNAKLGISYINSDFKHINKVK